jgi:CRISPR-associated protein Cmr2
MMYHDFYAYYQIENEQSIDQLINGSGKYNDILDTYQKILLLSTAYSKGKGVIDYAKSGNRRNRAGLIAILHSQKKYDQYIHGKLNEIKSLGIDSSIDITLLPKGSWILEFQLELEKPFLSKDDIPFYIIENPVKKDVVFGVPYTPATTWKGNLRWAMMKEFLEKKKDDPEEFAETRFRHTLLFGTEKGWEGTPKGWSEYLDRMCPDAKRIYRKKLTEMFEKNNDKPEDIHVEGMLHFYPTFWDRIDLMVINPHDRKTKTGKNPIYFEIVPEGAKGMFRLLYVPYYWLGDDDEKLKKKVWEDLSQVIAGVKAMMLKYGFSAKKTIGFGKARNNFNTGRVEIKGFLSTREFSNFEELESIWGVEDEHS